MSQNFETNTTYSTPGDIAYDSRTGAPIVFPFYTELIVSTGLVTLPGQGASTSYSQTNVIIGDNAPP